MSVTNSYKQARDRIIRDVIYNDLGLDAGEMWLANKLLGRKPQKKPRDDDAADNSRSSN